MKKYILILFLLGVWLPINSQLVKREITGKIAKEDGPLKNVNVRVKNTSTGVLSNTKGKYEIKAFIGDTLVFSHVGFHTVQVLIDKDNNSYNLDMYPDIQELDEVVVRKNKRPLTQKELLAEYPTNKNLIKTSWGILNKETASFSIRVIDGDELVNFGSDIFYSLENLHPQMKVIRNCPNDLICPQVILQRWSSGAKPSAIFDVDGFIYEQAPTFLAASDVDRISILTRNGAVSRYGPAGSGGVIIINTKNQTVNDDNDIERTYDNSKLTDSINGVFSETKNYTKSVSAQMKSLTKSGSQKKALNLFENQKKENGENPYFFIDASEYFSEKWNNKRKSEEILNFVEEKFYNNADILKALAYSYEEQENFEKALVVYLKILKLRSRDAQSYRDVANAYAKNNKFKKALTYYARYELAMNQLDSVSYDKYGGDFLLTTEVQNIITLKGQELSLHNSNFKKDNMQPQNIRLLFEWNHTNADLKLRMVSPDDYYDDWQTPKAESIERIKGYYSKQFFLDEAFNGEWQIIANYNGNGEETPTYLKVTVIFDYNRPSQEKQTKVFKLSEKGINLKLLSVFTEKKYISP